MSVIVGFDSHPSSRAALIYGAALARRLGTEIHVVHVEDSSDQPVDPDELDYETELQTNLNRHERLARDLLGAEATDWDFTCVHGPIRNALRRMADRYPESILVIGERKPGLRAALSSVFDRPVASSIVRHTGCPVLVVPEG